MLIVLDNARDADQVRPLLPASGACLAVVTSRSRLTGLVAMEAARPLSLDVLSAEEARELLVRRLGGEQIAADPAAADELIRLCARLPLALAIAAARGATRPGLSLAALAAELREAHGQLDGLDAGDAATNIRAVFSWSCQNLSAPAARMFRLLGVHPGPDISAHAAASLAGIGRDKARAVLGELGRVSLIAEHVSGRFAFHDLLRAYAAEQASVIDGDAACQAAIHRVLDHYVHSANAAARLLYPARGARHSGAALPGCGTGAVRRLPARLGLVGQRVPGADRRDRARRVLGLRCPCLASSVVALRIPGPARAPAGLGRHPADRRGRRSPGWRPGRPGPRAP